MSKGYWLPAQGNVRRTMVAGWGLAAVLPTVAALVMLAGLRVPRAEVEEALRAEPGWRRTRTQASGRNLGSQQHILW